MIEQILAKVAAAAAAVEQLLDSVKETERLRTGSLELTIKNEEMGDLTLPPLYGERVKRTLIAASEAFIAEQVEALKNDFGIEVTIVREEDLQDDIEEALEILSAIFGTAPSEPFDFEAFKRANSRFAASDLPN